MGEGFLTSRRAKEYDKMDTLYYEQYCVNATYLHTRYFIRAALEFLVREFCENEIC